MHADKTAITIQSNKKYEWSSRPLSATTAIIGKKQNEFLGQAKIQLRIFKELQKRKGF